MAKKQRKHNVRYIRFLVYNILPLIIKKAYSGHYVSLRAWAGGGRSVVYLTVPQQSTVRVFPSATSALFFAHAPKRPL